MCLGVPMLVEKIDGSTATVELKGVRRSVSISLVEGEIRPGDYVLVHVGYAIARVDLEDAQETLSLIEQISSAGGGEEDA